MRGVPAPTFWCSPEPDGNQTPVDIVLFPITVFVPGFGVRVFVQREAADGPWRTTMAAASPGPGGLGLQGNPSKLSWVLLGMVRTQMLGSWGGMV